MARCRSINILILAFLLGSVCGLPTPIAWADDNDDLSFDNDVAPAEPAPARTGHSVWTVGILGGYGAAQQGSKSFTTSDNLTWNANGYSGNLFQGGVFATRNWTPSIKVRGFLAYQSYHFTGTATEVGVPIAPLAVALGETTGAGGIDVLYYVWPRHTLWVGGGMEYARGLSLNITLNGITVPTAPEDFVNYFKLSGMIGWDLPLAGPVILTPFMRIGDIVSEKPSIITFEGLVSIGYRL